MSQSGLESVDNHCSFMDAIGSGQGGEAITEAQHVRTLKAVHE